MPESPTHASISSSHSDSEAEDIPPFVSSVDPNAIASFATSVRYRLSAQHVTCAVNPVPNIGGFNVIWFINFDDDVKWVFRTPMAEWSEMLEKRMRADLLGMKLIREKTGIPIPEVHDFSTTKDSEPLGRPYVLMDKLEGMQLGKLWFDKEWFTEEKRKKVWKGLVNVMRQLKSPQLEFDQIGCLVEDDKGEIAVGPLLPSLDAIEEGATEKDISGPYSTTHAYLIDTIKRQMDAVTDSEIKASLGLLKLFTGALPDDESDGPPFVLAMPDFGYQNVLVDKESGDITGLIDWDEIEAKPRLGGYARYPSWITRDWDPLVYTWPTEDKKAGSEEDEGVEATIAPSRETLEEDSPTTLQLFRDEYLAAFEEVDPEIANLTRNSHVFEALSIAIFHPHTRLYILDRLTRYVFGKDAELGEPLGYWSLQQAIMCGDWLGVPEQMAN